MESVPSRPRALTKVKVKVNVWWDLSVEDGCCPFKIVFDEDLYVVFDEDIYVLSMYLCFALSMS